MATEELLEVLWATVAPYFAKSTIDLEARGGIAAILGIVMNARMLRPARCNDKNN